MKNLLTLAVLLGLFPIATLSLSAQTDEPPAAQPYQPLADQDLDTLIKPIALYPDPLIGQVLAAATLPTQIVLADRYVEGGGDPNAIASQPWDASVQSIAHYPTVLKWLDDNLDWTTELGEAFANQQSDVMNSIQRLRATAQNLGNLQSTPQQQVTDDGANIEIVPTDPDVIYVPVYDPDVIYVDSGGPFITFGVGFAIGWWLNCDFDWDHRHMIQWDHDHPRPSNWWHERGDRRAAGFAGHTSVWHPSNNRPGGINVRGGDRGWNNLAANRSVARPGQVGGHENRPDENRGGNVHVGPTVGQSRPSAPQGQHFDSPARAPEPSSDGFVGNQSSQAARESSDRGQQSMGEVQRPGAGSAARAEPSGGGSFHSSGGGGGGGHSSGGGGGGRH